MGGFFSSSICAVNPVMVGMDHKLMLLFFFKPALNSAPADKSPPCAPQRHSQPDPK
jgi:hypothetical protein